MTGPADAAPALEARALTRRFGGLLAVDDAALSAPAGRITALTGPNGAGKSTLFDCLAGRLRPNSGRVLLSGRDVTRLAPHARARLGLTRTFQHLAVFPSLTVRDNIRLGADHARPPDGSPTAPPAPTTEAVLDRLGLAPVADRAVGGLPTGTLRLVELGRALAARPAVVLLDEPGAGLDRAETARLAALLHDLAAADGLALLLVEHDSELIDRLADRVYAMAAGRVALIRESR